MSGVVYTLELQDACWYVGWTKDPATRIASHFLGAGSRWTLLHRPVAVTSVTIGDELMENLTTIALMCKHGWENVRGGNYCAVNMLAPPACIRTAMHYASPSDELVVGTATVKIHQNPGAGATEWRAYIRGPKASLECSKKGMKTIYAPSKQALIHKVSTWEANGD